MNQDLLGFFLIVPSALLLCFHGSSREKILRTYGILDVNFYTTYDINEADKYFKGMKILFKENRVLERIYEGQKIKQGYIDYIIKK
ncbi:hypothetical protein [Clostridium neuense]|uniref:hypothetical protein n=1 Tax=Clostridium neuense TaxID=1728934 RepID=UPI003877BEAF